MKSCILKNRSNGRVFHNSILWENFPHETFLNECLDVAYVGYIQALQADFLIVEEIEIDDLKKYDLIIYLSNNNELPNFKVDFIIPCEPQDYYATNNAYNFKVINNYLTELPINHLSVPYVYDLTTFRKFNVINKKNKILKQRRSPIINLENFEIVHEGAILDKHYSAWDTERTKFLKNLSECKYCYSTCGSNSPGQLIAEASILDVITFSTKQKLKAKLLLPEFCYIENEKEVPNKIIILENDLEFKNKLLIQIRNAVENHLNIDNFRKIING